MYKVLHSRATRFIHYILVYIHVLHFVFKPIPDLFLYPYHPWALDSVEEKWFNESFQYNHF